MHNNNNNRRRKKRPSYGVRTVEITKGKNGFGFTISGQAPCILSCIVPGSPAERAGLRPGDYLIAVNGQNVSKCPHDDVARLIGLSRLLKLQIAENYYSDSSDDEFVSGSRPKPKYPNRLRHKSQQTRAEKVVRDLQSGAIFGERARAAIHLSESGLLSESSYPSKSPIPEGLGDGGPPVGPSIANAIGPSTSPARLRPDQIHLVMAEARQAGRTPRPIKEPQQAQQSQPPQQKKLQQPQQQPQQPKKLHQAARHIIKKKDKGKGRGTPPSTSPETVQQQIQQQQQLQLQQQQMKLQQQQEQQALLTQQQALQQPQRQQSPIQQLQQHLWVGMDHLVADHPTGPTPEGHGGGALTEQEINKLLYPTLAELQQEADHGGSLYRAVVGYLGTIEMPKEPQGGSRLAAIRNCIRRLRIEKKVHTLVLMSVYPERVVLTNPHGLTLAQYPAERITFCGVYADDKKFFGLVTVHGIQASGDELSDDGSQDNGSAVSSSSCHVFMVDPRMVQHTDHARQAKNFRLECTAPHAEDGPYCLEFPDSADPILHAIIGLYRHRVGYQPDPGGAPGLIDVEAQMSPQHSNTSSNSSNSDSGIGFRDDGQHYHQHNERVFVVEVDDGHRMRFQNFQNLQDFQNFQLVGNVRNIGGGNLNESHHRASSADPHRPDNHRANLDNARSNRMPDNGRGSLDNGRTNRLPDNVRANLDNGRSSRITDNSRLNLDNARPSRISDNADNGYRPSYPNNSLCANNLRANEKSTSGIDENCANVRVDNVRAVFHNGLCVNAMSIDNISANNVSANICEVRDICDSIRVDNIRMDNILIDNVSANIRDVRDSIRVENGLDICDNVSANVRDVRTNDHLRVGISDEMWTRDGRVESLLDRGVTKTPVEEYETERLTVRAMPDPVGFERSPPGGCIALPDSPVQMVSSMRHSMHKYLQHKQEHLVKVSQKINSRRGEADPVGPMGPVHPLSVRAFSPSTVKTGSAPLAGGSGPQDKLDLELSLKLSPKVFGLPQQLGNPVGSSMSPLLRPPLRAPSERSFTRSLEDLRESSTSEGGPPMTCGSSLRDGSESDHGPLMPGGHIVLHASDNNLALRAGCMYPGGQHPRGAFRAVPQRYRGVNHGPDPLSSIVGGLVGGPGAGRLAPDSGDDAHTENTENTGEREGSQDVHPPTQDEFSLDSDSEQVS